ncbi:MAG: hypothetical protein NVSMB62_06160 [Acidobacteriaceae bacterium]
MTVNASELQAADLAGYPAQGRALATEHLALLRELPFPYLVVVLRELIGFDWKLPAERQRLVGHMEYLARLDSTNRVALMLGFASLKVDGGLLRSRWASNPAATLEQLTAWLWSSHQMDGFRQAADAFATAMSEAVPPGMPRQPRLGVVVLGQGVVRSPIPLFRKLRPRGVYLQHVQPERGMEILLDEVQRRAQASAVSPHDSDAFVHWYIDGGAVEAAPAATQISYAALQPARQRLLQRTQQAIESGGMGPERLRSMLAQLRPGDIGLPGGDGVGNDVLSHFQMSLLTEGSGTQIFSTTFVQWAARECLRRAEPETLMLRYAPRQQQQPMNVMLSGGAASALDPEGSLVDADMGAYYTWLNLRRLTGADQMRFLVWFEGHGEALVVGPGLPGGTTSDSAMDMQGVLKLLA